MSLIPRKASYSSEPIRSVEALSKALKVDASRLHQIAKEAPRLYRKVKPPPGSTRQTFDALPELKAIHERIKSQILTKVVFPDYLTGSLKGRDYSKNAGLHAGKRVVICEDVKSFFSSVTSSRVHDIWLNFFGFSPEVSQLLTQLTTKDGTLPQGAIPSSFLANLVLWRIEPLLHAKLAAQQIEYSRYVDDMTMSSHLRLSRSEKSRVIAQVYGMLRSAGLKAGRNKHEIFGGKKPMIVTKLQVNGMTPSLPQKKRANVRAALFELERMVIDSSPGSEHLLALSKVSQRVGQLNRFHKGEGSRLKARLSTVGEKVAVLGISVSTVAALPESSGAEQSKETLPWE